MDLPPCVESLEESIFSKGRVIVGLKWPAAPMILLRIFVLIIRFLSICSHLSINIFVLKKVDLTLFLDLRLLVSTILAISGKAIRWRKRRRKSLPKRAEMW